MGILNVTQDSFSDGGQYLDTSKAIAHARKLVADGADVIDIGAASSNPATKPVATEEEIRRLTPLIEKLHEENIPVSIDSFNPAVQLFALQKNVAYLNDIQGFPFPEIYPQITASSCKLIVMHSVQKTGPATVVDSQPQEVLDAVFRFFSLRIKELETAGITPDRMVLDPGMGFFLGSNPESSVLVLKNTARLKKEFGLPVLAAVSRKSFLGQITGSGVHDRGAATLAAELFACSEGADYIRTHDVKALKDALKVLEKLA